MDDFVVLMAVYREPGNAGSGGQSGVIAVIPGSGRCNLCNPNWIKTGTEFAISPAFSRPRQKGTHLPLTPYQEMRIRTRIRACIAARGRNLKLFESCVV
jgi:hypothetical protein